MHQGQPFDFAISSSFPSSSSFFESLSESFSESLPAFLAHIWQSDTGEHSQLSLTPAAESQSSLQQGQDAQKNAANSHLQTWQFFVPMRGFQNPSTPKQLRESRGQWLALQQLQRSDLQDNLWLRIRKEQFQRECARSVTTFLSWRRGKQNPANDSHDSQECEQILLYSGQWNLPYTVYTEAARLFSSGPNVAFASTSASTSGSGTAASNAAFVHPLRSSWQWIPIPLETNTIYFHVQSKELDSLLLGLPWFADKHSSWISLLQKNSEVLLLILFLLLLGIKSLSQSHPPQWNLMALIFTVLFASAQLLQGFSFPDHTLVRVLNAISLSMLLPAFILSYMPSLRIMSLHGYLHFKSFHRILLWGRSEKIATISFVVALFLLVGPFPLWYFSIFLGGGLLYLCLWLVLSQNISKRHYLWETSALATIIVAFFYQFLSLQKSPVLHHVPVLFWLTVWLICLFYARKVEDQTYLRVLLREYLKYKNRINIRLKTVTNAYSRFVPQEFIRILKKDQITQVSLGDNVEMKVTIMVADMHSFTTLSEQMSPSENFRFVNSYLAAIGPTIRNHQGFVLKFLGDGLMALFPIKAEDAVHAAIDMQKKLISYNETRTTSRRKSVRTGIGIHTGVVRLGTVGEKARLQADIISDAANLASRIEGLTRNYGVTILMSQDTKIELQDYSDFDMRTLDLVKVKGKEKETKVIEVLSPQIDPHANLKIASKARFEEGFRALYFEKHYLQAIDCFEAVLSENPQDPCAQVLLDRATYLVLNKGDHDQDGQNQQISLDSQITGELRNLE